MRTRFHSALGVCVIALTGVPVVLAQGPAPKSNTTGDNLVVNEGAQTASLQCTGVGNLSVTGAANTLKVTGPCKTVTVTGAANHITIELAESAQLTITGAGNDVRYKAPAGSKPAITVSGAGSRATPIP